MPAIPASTPHETPAVPAKVYPHIWVRRLTASSDGVNPDSSLYLQLSPFDEATGEIDLETTRMVSVPLWECLAMVPEAAVAMQAVFAAVPAIEAWAAQRNENL